jgi:hypothetical protein
VDHWPAWPSLSLCVRAVVQTARELQNANEMEGGFLRFLFHGPLRKLTFYNPRFFAVYHQPDRSWGREGARDGGLGEDAGAEDEFEGDESDEDFEDFDEPESEDSEQWDSLLAKRNRLVSVGSRIEE